MKNRYAYRNFDKAIVKDITNNNVLPEPESEHSVYEDDKKICIFCEDGFPKYKVLSGSIVPRSQDEIENDTFIDDYKIKKKDELFGLLNSNLFQILQLRDLADLKIQWQNIVTNSASWISKSDVDNAFSNAITWLGL